jgi:hypothetical protein
MLTWVSLTLITSCSALSPQFLQCQIQKSAGQSPLIGCPEGTIYVSGNANDSFAHFSKVQDAVESLSDNGELAVILIGEGQYFEAVNITRSSPLTILGQLPPSFTSVPVSTPFANASRPNLVQIFNTVFVENGIDDAASAVLTVAPNGAAALIGAGPTGAPPQGAFGNVDFKMYNVDIQNRAVRVTFDGL